MQIIIKSAAVALGLKKYFTGKTCKQGHISERYTTKSTCIECLKISSVNRHEQKKECDRKRYYSLTEEQKTKERERLRIHRRKMYLSNPEKYRKEALDFQRKNRESNLERLRKWKEENKDWFIQYRQLDYVKDQAKFRASRRRSIKLQAMPLWADIDKIEQIYKSCPNGYHVDHIVPLVSKIVCGLHCEANLMHLEAKENMVKGNRTWPDMP